VIRRGLVIVALGAAALSGDAVAEEDPTTGHPPATAGFADAPFADEASAKPTADEWRSAPEVEPTRRGPRAARCHVWRVREWVRVSCPDLVTASIAMLGGTAQGMAFWIDPVREGADGKLPSGGEVLFPVRRGDRRVVQLLSFGAGYEGPFTQLPALVVQESWLPDEEEPVLLLH
jgi:hypothetical protein